MRKVSSIGRWRFTALELNVKGSFHMRDQSESVTAVFFLRAVSALVSFAHWKGVSLDGLKVESSNMTLGHHLVGLVATLLHSTAIK